MYESLQESIGPDLVEAECYDLNIFIIFITHIGRCKTIRHPRRNEYDIIVVQTCQTAVQDIHSGTRLYINKGPCTIVMDFFISANEDVKPSRPIS